MAVLIEAFCVVMRVSSVQERHPGGIDAFVANAPPDRICTDGQLLSARFSAPDELMNFVRHIKSTLLAERNSHHTRPYDLAIAEQNLGLLTCAPWLEFFPIGIGENTKESAVSACALFDRPRIGGDIGTYLESSNLKLAVPEGWTFKDSLSDKLGAAYGNEGPALWVDRSP